MTKKIAKIIIEMIPDYDADLSYLGEYSDKPGPGAIDREEQGDMERGEFRYFNPGNYDPSLPVDEQYKYALQDYERHEAYNRGSWGCVGIKAHCDYLIDKGNGYWIYQDMKSGGLWGIESDSGDDYFIEVANGEIKDLIRYLKEVGFTDEEITPFTDAAMAKFRDEVL